MTGVRVYQKKSAEYTFFSKKAGPPFKKEYGDAVQIIIDYMYVKWVQIKCKHWHDFINF